jgi:hypothetical protein
VSIAVEALPVVISLLKIKHSLDVSLCGLKSRVIAEGGVPIATEKKTTIFTETVVQIASRS